MSQHPSLRSKSKDAVQRSVHKRYERLKEMSEKEKWDEEKRVYGLPKLKVAKFKVKKEKGAPDDQEAAAGEAGDTVKDQKDTAVKGSDKKDSKAGK